MQDQELTGLINYAIAAFGGGGALVGLALYARKFIKNMGLEDVHRSSEQNSVETSDRVLKNIQDELARHAARIKELEDRVEELTGKLANVRLLAIDCYSLATTCECQSDARSKLLEHLKQIIKDA